MTSLNKTSRKYNSVVKGLYAVPERPLILFVDGHKSHVTLEVIDLAREKNVILFCLPPHTTHALQPLDVAVFKSLKAYFLELV